MQFLFRLMSGPILHGSWAGTVGWFIAVAALRSGKKSPRSRAMAALHGLYDVFASDILGLGLAGITFVIFMAYLGHGDDLEKNSHATVA